MGNFETRYAGLYPRRLNEVTLVCENKVHLKATPQIERHEVVLEIAGKVHTLDKSALQDFIAFFVLLLEELDKDGGTN